MIQYDTNVNQI